MKRIQLEDTPKNLSAPTNAAAKANATYPHCPKAQDGDFNAASIKGQSVPTATAAIAKPRNSREATRFPFRYFSYH